MTADLTPAQAARLEAIEAAPYAEEAAVERVARAIASESVAVTLVTDDEWNFYLRPDEQDDFRRLAVAAIDVMRGATDDGAVGRLERKVQAAKDVLEQHAWGEDDPLAARDALRRALADRRAHLDPR